MKKDRFPEEQNIRAWALLVRVGELVNPKRMYEYGCGKDRCGPSAD